MRHVRMFAIGLGAGILLAVVLIAIAVDRSGGATPEGSSRSTDASVQASGPASTLSSDEQRARDMLLSWQAAGTPPKGISSQIMAAALGAFATYTRYDGAPLSSRVVFLNTAGYAARSRSPCDDAADVRPTTEAWLLNVPGDTLFVNGGFVSASPQSAIDLFFRYVIGLYALAPELKSYPNGVQSSDGQTVYYEKGLILLGKRGVDQVTKTDCYLEYRRSLQDAFTADRALDLLAHLGLAPAPTYFYPQKPSLEAYRAKIATRLGGTEAELLEPFLKTDSGDFYRRVGRALGSTGDPAASEATADRLFRAVFPTG